MGQTSEAVLALKPVTFQYKSDKKGAPQFGLIAEEVARVNPDLVVHDKNGKVVAVRYDQVNAMLLNEFLKEHKTVQELESKATKQDATIADLRSRVAKQEATIAELKSGMKTLAATVKEQAAQIEKVSAQISVSKPAPQVVSNNP